MTTIRELADKLGVSVATVSRAMNDKPGVSSEVRKNILALSRELNYFPNHTARNLTTARTRNILFVVHRWQTSLSADPFYPYIMQGMEEILTNEGYSVSLVTLTHDQIASGPESLRVLQERRGDAIVLAGPGFSPGFILETTLLGNHTLLIDNALKETPFPAILTDNQGGCEEITRHLIEIHDHNKIALLRGPKEWISSQERANGYLQAMEMAELAPIVFYAEDTTLETGRETAMQALDSNPELTAIVAVNDAMAIGAMRSVRAQRKSVPEDIAVVGFDNISWAAYAEPPLTTVSIPTIEIGRLAARLLLEHLDETITVKSRTTVATHMIVRNSCGCQP